MISDNLAQAKARLQFWQQSNALDLQQYFSCLKIDQPLRIRQQFAKSPYLLMHRIKKMKCQICRYAGQYKYFRAASMFDHSQSKRCLVFMVCQSCFEMGGDKLPIEIDKQSYVAMHIFVSMVEEGIHSFHRQQKYAQQVIKKYDIFESRLSNVIWQLLKSVQKKRGKVCSKVFYQIDTLRQMFKKKQCEQIYSVLLKAERCRCKSQCCYCDYRDANEDNAKANCQYYQLKKQQNQIITQMNLLKSIEGVLENKEERIFNGIIKEVEMVIIGHMQAIEKSLDQIIQNTSHFSLVNPQFIQTLTKNYQHLPKPQNGPLLINESKQKYIQQGVVNHMTFQDLQRFPNEITSISLDYMRDESTLKAKLKKLDKLSKIEVGCNEIGCLLVSQTVKSNQKKASTPQPQPHQSTIQQPNIHPPQQKAVVLQGQQDSFLNIGDFKQLQSLSFNCVIPFKQQFFAEMGQLAKMSQLYLNWNCLNFFERFNQSSHFLQGSSLVNSTAPNIAHIQHLYEKHTINNIWIPNCALTHDKANQSDIQKYSQIIASMVSRLQGVMMGQFDGKQRIIEGIIYRELSQCKSLKALFLNRITFDNKQMCTVLNNNDRVEALYFNQCQGFQSTIFDTFDSLLNLKKLSIIQIRTVAFKNSIASLQTFILQRCYDIIGDEVALLLKAAKLKHLSLYQCRFIDDETIRQIIKQQIANKTSLQSVNLGFTKMSNETLNLLNYFPKLRCLHLGGTNLNLSLLLSDICHSKLSNLGRLQRLSLKQMLQIERSGEQQSRLSQYYNDIFSYILQYFPLLSHLDISGNKGINERAFRFGLMNLAFLNVKDTLYSLREGKRIDHPGTACPFFKGRLAMGKGQTESDEQGLLSQSVKKQDVGIRIIY